MTLPADISLRGLRTPPEQEQLVVAVRDAAPDEQETDWLEWKRQLDLRSPKAIAHIAKTVLGFSNRDPQVARRQAGGLAYLLVGVQPGALLGIELPAPDHAQLLDQVGSYVGRLPRWTPAYVQVDGQTVLLVTVEAPEQGDPPHPARKRFQQGDDGGLRWEDGALFIRRGARTIRATGVDVDMLARRCQPQPEPAPELAVDVEVGGDTDVERFDDGRRGLEAFAEEESWRLLDPVSDDSSITGVSPRLGRRMQSPARYRESVERYVAELRAVEPAMLQSRALQHRTGFLRLRLVNQSRIALDGLQLEAEFRSGDVRGVYTGAYALDEPAHELPRAPSPWEDQSYVRFPAVLRPVIPRPARERPQVSPVADGFRVVFPPVDLRSRTTIDLDSLLLLVGPEAGPEVTVAWRAASMNINDHREGQLTVPVSDRIWSPAELLALTDDEQEDER